MDQQFELIVFENKKCKIVKFYDEYYLFVKLNKYQNKCFDNLSQALTHVKEYNFL